MTFATEHRPFAGTPPVEPGDDLTDPDIYARGVPLTDSVRAVADAVSALHQLHSAGIRHGDFKPGNILVDPRGRGVLIDLSCTALLGEPLEEVSGTPGYLAPEFARGRADHRSDFFAVGITLRDIAELRGEALPEQLRKLAERLTRPDPRTRPGDAAEILEALGRTSLAPHPLLVPKALLGRERELSFLEHWLEPVVHLGEAQMTQTTGVKVGLALVATTAGLLGIAIAAAVYLRKRADLAAKIEKPIFAKGWLYDATITAFMGGPGRKAFDAIAWFDKTVVDGAVNGVGSIVREGSGKARLVQTGFVRNYALGIAFGAVVVTVLLLTQAVY